MWKWVTSRWYSWEKFCLAWICWPSSWNYQSNLLLRIVKKHNPVIIDTKRTDVFVFRELNFDWTHLLLMMTECNANLLWDSTTHQKDTFPPPSVVQNMFIIIIEFMTTNSNRVSSISLADVCSQSHFVSEASQSMVFIQENRNSVLHMSGSANFRASESCTSVLCQIHWSNWLPLRGTYSMQIPRQMCMWNMNDRSTRNKGEQLNSTPISESISFRIGGESSKSSRNDIIIFIVFQISKNKFFTCRCLTTRWFRTDK